MPAVIVTSLITKMFEDVYNQRNIHWYRDPKENNHDVFAGYCFPFLLFIKNKPLAIFLSACISTLILKVWAYFAIGGFDLGFLFVQIMISLCAAGTASFMMDRIGNSKVKAT